MTATLDHDTFAAEWQAWHDEHERRRADRHGFLAITGLYWLDGTPRRFDDAPGAWSTGPSGVVVELADGEHLTLDGERLTGRHGFGVIPERGGVFPAWGDAVIEVARRGGFDLVRPRHPDAPVLAAYTGTAAFPASPEWVADGRFVAFDEPRPTTVGAVVDDLRHVYDAPGEVRFTLRGEQLALTAFPGHDPGSLLLLFTDATSGVTTYAANRALSVVPDEDGRVRVDFNRAVNLPCAYTELATCPLPPDGNRLAVAIEAGERTPA